MAPTTPPPAPLQQDARSGYQQFLRNLHRRSRDDAGAGQRTPDGGERKAGRRRASPG